MPPGAHSCRVNAREGLGPARNGARQALVNLVEPLDDRPDPANVHPGGGQGDVRRHPGSDTCWILARTPQLTPELLGETYRLEASLVGRHSRES